MRKTTILLVRHGQSEGNILGVFTGHSGYPLSELGHKQAEMTGEYIRKNYYVDAVYCSDLPRAFQTAEHIAHAFALPVVTDCNFREINAGEWENKRFVDLPDLFPKDYAIWMNDLIHARCTGGESVEEVGKRTIKALEDLASANPNKCIVVVAHATTIRSAVWKTSGGTKDAMDALSWGGNCGISELCYVDGKLQALTYNCADHICGFSSVLPKNV